MKSERRKIVAFTGCRSDYDLVSGLYQRLQQDPQFDFSLLVSGAHLSAAQGETVRMIETDGLTISARIPSVPLVPAHEARLESAANLFQGAAAAIGRSRPDLLLFAGDREDVIIAALVGLYLGVPTAHFFGGDHAEDGHVDHLVRHATSKLSSVHFVATANHRERLLALGESSRRIFQIGSPALDKFLQEPVRSLSEIGKSIDRMIPEKYAILIYHPMSEHGMSTGEYMENIFRALADEKIFTFVSTPNIDHGHEKVNAVIDRHRNNPNFYCYHNLPRDAFVNLLRGASFLIGNSSAGIVEGPFLRLPVVNVGNRQRGRTTGRNVLFVNGDGGSIRNALQEIKSPYFRETLGRTESLYGDGHSSERAYRLLKELNYQEFLRKTDDPLSPPSSL